MSPFNIIVLVLVFAAVGYVIFYIYATVSKLGQVVKESKVLPPTPLSDCPADKEKSGALCYNKCDKGGKPDAWNRIAATCWLKKTEVGIGTIPLSKKPCDPGQRDDGASCWDDLRCDLVGDPSKPVWVEGHQRIQCQGSGSIKKWPHERSDCGDKVYIAGLCYDKCPNGMEHIPGAPTFCKPPGDFPVSYTPGNDPGTPMDCPAGKVKDGALCYPDPGPDWKVVGGVAYKYCPAGFKDIGAFCIPTGANAPWYMSIYLLLAAILIIVGAGFYLRFAMRNPAVVAAGARINNNKKGRNK